MYFFFLCAHCRNVNSDSDVSRVLVEQQHQQNAIFLFLVLPLYSLKISVESKLYVDDFV